MEPVDRAFFVAGIIIILSILLLYSCDLANPPKSLGAWIEVSFTVPDRYADNGASCGLPDSAIVDSTGALILGSPMSTARMAYLYGFHFTDPGALSGSPSYQLLDSMDVEGFDGIKKTMAFWDEPGKMGSVLVTVGNYGMESCKTGGFTYAIPAVDSSASLSDALRHYDLTWKKP
jgi:hypothetical protein